ncbi:hypothetical protein ABT009_37385 [Streptomyces sp. NPDC002896]|uniref:hypothetical protein n=1 Tax=Streptomyces sp. NPDC002896 TaxID=3154438 RepID=UPI00332B7D88
MDALLPYLIVTGALGAIIGFFAWLASVVRRRGVAGAGIRAAMASYDEAFHVTAHDSHYEIQAQAEAESRVSSPDAPWRLGGGITASPAADMGGTVQLRPRRRGRGLRRGFGLLGRRR